MAKIEGFRIRNFKSLRDITLGRLWNDKGTGELTPMTAVIGKNGTGKSTLFDAFGFLSDCLKYGVNDGFSKIRRASEYPVIQGLVKEGLLLGGLWYSDYLDDNASPSFREMRTELRKLNPEQFDNEEKTH